MFTTTATVTRRFRRDGIYLLAMNITGAIVRFQRREFYRVSYMVDVDYQTITREIARSSSSQEVEYAIMQDPDLFAIQKGRMLDVSGGGLRFSTKEQLEYHSYLYLGFRLKNRMMDESFSMVGQVVSSQKHPKEPDLYINRVQFLLKDLRDREKIVRFVFEEERRIRNKGADD
jgi:c-di-GMP-binding flagellar brake protein YcgR